MDPLIIPVVAIVMVFSLGIVGAWTKHREKIAMLQIDTTAEHTAEKAAQYASHIQKLEDRVQVLERIVTDKGYDIATQIEALRDTRQVEDTGSGVPLNVNTKERA